MRNQHENETEGDGDHSTFAVGCLTFYFHVLLCVVFGLVGTVVGLLFIEELKGVGVAITIVLAISGAIFGYRTSKKITAKHQQK